MYRNQTEAMPLVMLRAGDCGMGLAAARDLRPGAVVARFDGPIVPFSELPESEIRYAILIAEDRWLIPGSDARYLNHSCDPNCRVLDSLDVATIRDVPAGAELTISYNTIEPWERADYFAHPEHYFWDERWSFQCRCGAANCRGLVDSYWVRPDPKPLIAPSPGKGRGVFTSQPYLTGDVVERAAVIVVPGAQWPHLEQTTLYDYSYSWGPAMEDAAICLGHGSLYNHSYQPNMIYRRLLESLQIEFIALRDIARGEELTVNYNGDPEDGQPLWFAAR